jgi:hypothetical protein
MNVLIMGEFSGTIRDAFARKGHHAVSCDLLPSEKPGFHYQGPVQHLLGLRTKDGSRSIWDLMIAHPDCTYLCSSGLHWNKRRPGRSEKTEEALAFVQLLMGADIEKIAIENPQGCIGTRIMPASQYIQPNEYGHDASKKTGLWLKNLPKLIPTCHIPPRIVEWPKGSGRMVKRWGNQTDSGQNKLPPSATRWMERARTYPGWADAMVERWG